MEIEEFYKDLQCELDKVNKTDYIIIIGDLNARIGKNPVLNVVGDNGEDVLNEKGRQLIDFAASNSFKITNSFFRHKDIHKIYMVS
ncbi:Craniofacial development protein 2 [Blattella germanica]|nr:Craniofacial development protein 2 [Blattella germanica]